MTPSVSTSRLQPSKRVGAFFSINTAITVVITGIEDLCVRGHDREQGSEQFFLTASIKTPFCWSERVSGLMQSHLASMRDASHLTAVAEAANPASDFHNTGKAHAGSVSLSIRRGGN
jgi:hypothetical protein